MSTFTEQVEEAFQQATWKACADALAVAIDIRIVSSTGELNLSDLSDVNKSAKGNKKVLEWNAASGKHIYVDPSTLINHNNTLTIQGGSSSERYHLTQSQHTLATNLASLPGIGLLAKIDSSTYGTRSLAVGSTKVVITNGSGVGGNPTIDIDDTKIDHTHLLNRGVKTHILLDAHVDSVSNPHATTATQVGLGNVTNNAQIKKSASSTNGNIPTWNGGNGDSLNNGYGVETVLAGGSNNLARADAIKDYIDANAGGGGSVTILPAETKYVDQIDTLETNACHWIVKVFNATKIRLSEILSQAKIVEVLSTEYAILGDVILMDLDVDLDGTTMRLKITNNEVDNLQVVFKRLTI